MGESLIKVLSEEDALTRLNMTLRLSPLPMRLTDSMGSMGEYDESSDQGYVSRHVSSAPDPDDMEPFSYGLGRDDDMDEGDPVESGSGSEEEHDEADDGEYETSSDPVVMPIPLHGKKRERQIEKLSAEK